jgi:DNA-binding NtrC family response regulator
MVEDDVLVSTVVLPALEAAGHEVRLCHSADHALEALREHSYDALFTDVVMPGRMDGHDLARWCRVHRPELAVVLATGYSARAGAAIDGKLLSKPYSIDELLQALDEAASQQARTAAAHA